MRQTMILPMLEPIEATADCVRRLEPLYGEAARQWALRVPDLIAHAGDAWDITVGDPLASGYGLLFRARRADSTPAVLKMVFPQRSEVCREVSVLRAAGGARMAQLYEADIERGLLLIEEVVPGRSLLDLAYTNDSAATRVVAELLLGHVLPLGSQAVPSVVKICADLRLYQRGFGTDGPVPPSLAENAGRIAASLWASASSPRLLHGDLHHGNVLRSTRAGWLMIDPKGFAGELAFELAALLINPMDMVRDCADPASLLDRRVDVLREILDVDRERVVAWTYVRAVVAEVWNVLDGGSPHGGPLALARALHPRVAGA